LSSGQLKGGPVTVAAAELVELVTGRVEFMMTAVGVTDRADVSLTPELRLVAENGLADR
jgi:hypothetical protein